jgi:hypothetical protein
MADPVYAYTCKFIQYFGGMQGDWRFGVVAGLFGGYAGERFAGYGVQARAVTRLPRKLVFVCDLGLMRRPDAGGIESAQP